MIWLKKNLLLILIVLIISLFLIGGCVGPDFDRLTCYEGMICQPIHTVLCPEYCAGPQETITISLSLRDLETDALIPIEKNPSVKMFYCAMGYCSSEEMVFVLEENPELFLIDAPVVENIEDFEVRLTAMADDYSNSEEVILTEIQANMTLVFHLESLSSQEPICGNSRNECESGILEEVDDTTTKYKWNCVNDGLITECELEKPLCGEARNDCDVGVFISRDDTSTKYKWACTLEGETVECEKNKDSGNGSSGTGTNGTTSGGTGGVTGIECNTDTDCGTEQVTRSNFCFGNRIMKTVVTYTCRNPGTSLSRCVSKEEDILVEVCGYTQDCVNGRCVESKVAVVEDSCTKNSDCKSTEHCVNNRCIELVCDPGYKPVNHECVPEDTPTPEEEPEQENLLFLIIGILLLLIILVIVGYYIYKKRKEKNDDFDDGSILDDPENDEISTSVLEKLNEKIKEKKLK